jgi:hypothetical protein
LRICGGNGLYGHRWPAKSLYATELCDVLDEASLILQAMRAGMSLEAAQGSVIVARGIRARGHGYTRWKSR